MVGDNESQKLSSWYPEDALRGVEHHVVLPQIVKGLLQIRYKAILLLRHNGDVVHICVDVSPDLIRQALLHSALIRCSCVFQTEWYCDIAICAIRCYE
jgi:hypothetical protein